MTHSKRINITSLMLLLVAVAGTAAHHLYEQHLSSGYAPILRATLQSSHLEERAAYIHEARVAVRTDKDREVETKLEKVQADLDGSLIKDACGDYQWWNPTPAEKLKSVKALSLQSSLQSACVSANVPVNFKDADRLYRELRATAGLPLI
jgi:hypothetical protein